MERNVKGLQIVRAATVVFLWMWRPSSMPPEPPPPPPILKKVVYTNHRLKFFIKKKERKSCRNCDNLPPSYHQLAVGLEIREIRQTGLATAGQLMSSQFNHCVGSWGS